MKVLLFLISSFISLNAQISGKPIYIDLTCLENTKIDVGFITIGKLNDSLLLKYELKKEFPLVKQDTIILTNLEKDSIKYISSVNNEVNFYYSRNKYYVSQLEKKCSKMYIYIYTGNEKLVYNDPRMNENEKKELIERGFSFSELKQYSQEIQGFTIDNLKFKKGTYLINIFNSKDSINQKISSGEQAFDKANREMIIKISSKSYSPDDLEKYYKDKSLKRPKAIEELLSVFED